MTHLSRFLRSSILRQMLVELIDTNSSRGMQKICSLFSISVYHLDLDFALIEWYLKMHFLLIIFGLGVSKHLCTTIMCLVWPHYLQYLYTSDLHVLRHCKIEKTCFLFDNSTINVGHFNTHLICICP